MSWIIKNIRFDGSAFNYIEPSVMEDIVEALHKNFIEFYKILTTSSDAHLYLYIKEGKILLDFGVYGTQPHTFDIHWVITKGVRYETHESYTDEVSYFGSNTYQHDDFYRVKGESIELI